MCGIVGYVGPQDARDVVLEGLRRLEYRGYDSAGIAVVADGAAERRRRRPASWPTWRRCWPSTRCPAATIGIGHTRWATHGGPTDRNAHPHLSADGSVAVIHNGIIENFAALRAECERDGVEFRSETDTEVAAHLLAAAYADAPEGAGRLAEAMRVGLPPAGGRLHPRRDLTPPSRTPSSPPAAAARSWSASATASTSSGSDVAAFIAHTREARELGQDQVVEIDRDRGLTVTDFAGTAGRAHGLHGRLGRRRRREGRLRLVHAQGDRRAAAGDRRHPARPARPARASSSSTRCGCPTRSCATSTRSSSSPAAPRYHAGLIAKYAIEHWTRIPVEVELASEFRYRDPVLDRSTLVVVISQSGETMDTLMALRHAREQKARVLAICNANGSTIPRESDAVLYTHAGPGGRGRLDQGLPHPGRGLLPGRALPRPGARHEVRGRGRRDRRRPAPAARGRRRRCSAGMEPVRELARSLADANTILFLGRHVGFPVALEGALKLKELAYIHAEGFAAGELKHGPIAVIDQGTPVIVVVPSPRSRESVHGKVVSNIQEVRARGAPHHRDRRGGRRRRRALRRPPHPGAAHARRCSRRSSPRSRCRCWPARSPTPAAGRRPAAEPGQVRHRRVSALMIRSPDHQASSLTVDGERGPDAARQDGAGAARGGRRTAD